MGGNEYGNVVTRRAVGPIDLEFFRNVQAIEAETETHEKGDIMDGLIVGLDMLVRFCGTRKYRRRMFLITDGEKETKYTRDELKEIVKTINDNDIKLNCITLDFCNDLAEDDSDEEEEDAVGPDNKMKKEKESGESEA